MKLGYVVRDGDVVQVLHGTKAVFYEGEERVEAPVEFVEGSCWEDARRKIPLCAEPEPASPWDETSEGVCRSREMAMDKYESRGEELELGLRKNPRDMRDNVQREIK